MWKHKSKEQIGLDTLVILTVNNEYKVNGGRQKLKIILPKEYDHKIKIKKIWRFTGACGLIQ